VTANRVLGIDVSRWQDDNSTPQMMDFRKSYESGARFVFIKSSQAKYADEDILLNWKNAKAAGLLRGAYHFLTWNYSARVQAQYAWSIIEKDPGELPPVCDFEHWGVVPEKAYDWVWNFVFEMERLSGRVPIIYTGAFFWEKYGTTARIWDRYPLWIASYSSEAYMTGNVKNLTPWSSWTFWQFTDRGDGIAFGAESKQLDMNWFNGSLEDLSTFADLKEPCTGEEPSSETEAPPVAVSQLKARVLVQKLNVRSGPGISYPVVGSLSANSIAPIYDVAGSESWLKIGDMRWIANTYGGQRYVEIE